MCTTSNLTGTIEHTDMLVSVRYAGLRKLTEYMEKVSISL